MRADGVLDTNVVVLLDRVRVEDLPRRPVITAVTLGELSVGPLVTDDPDERARRQLRLQEVEATLTALPFDDAAARTLGLMAASLRRAGRKTSARALDVLIAAVAGAQQLPLYTSNVKDFEGLPGLDVVAVPVPPA